jgi:hypothetical protein
MPDLDNEYEAQDEAEAFDETHSVDEMALGGDEPAIEPDVDEDVYDVTSAQGDADEDEEIDADDLDPEDLDELEDEDDEDDDDYEDDEFEDEDDGLDDEDEDENEAVDAAAGRAAPIEPGLVYAADIDPLTNPRDDEVEKYESTRGLSDAQLADLGYRDAEAAPEPAPESAKEQRSFAAEDIEDESDPHESRGLDESLEDTFPASDPVSAKHIS